jgi:peptidyl-prolyl cis-trans isomerase C
MRAMLAGRCGWLIWMLALPVAAGAEDARRETILVQNSRMTLTRAEYEIALERLVPAERRPEFSSSAEHVTSLLNRLILRKTLAAEAREAGLDREPLPEGADAETVLAARRLAKLDVDAKADFNRRIEVFTAKAREDYLVNRQTYLTAEEVEWSWVFVDAQKRGEEAALGIADRVRAALAGGAAFAPLAQEFSDDPASASAGGRMPWASRSELHPVLADTLFAMKEVGEISGVVHTRIGYHILRLDGRKPPRQRTFDEVKDLILERLREAHVEAWRAEKTKAIETDPGIRVDQAAIDALVIVPDPDATRKILRALPSPSTRRPPN